MSTIKILIKANIFSGIESHGSAQSRTQWHLTVIRSSLKLVFFKKNKEKKKNCCLYVPRGENCVVAWSVSQWSLSSHSLTLLFSLSPSWRCCSGRYDVSAPSTPPSSSSNATDQMGSSASSLPSLQGSAWQPAPGGRVPARGGRREGSEPTVTSSPPERIKLVSKPALLLEHPGAGAPLAQIRRWWWRERRIRRSPLSLHSPLMRIRLWRLDPIVSPPHFSCGYI